MPHLLHCNANVLFMVISLKMNIVILDQNVLYGNNQQLYKIIFLSLTLKVKVWVKSEQTLT